MKKIVLFGLIFLMGCAQSDYNEIYNITAQNGTDHFNLVIQNHSDQSMGLLMDHDDSCKAYLQSYYNCDKGWIKEFVNKLNADEELQLVKIKKGKKKRFIIKTLPKEEADYIRFIFVHEIGGKTISDTIYYSFQSNQQLKQPPCD